MSGNPFRRKDVSNSAGAPGARPLGIEIPPPPSRSKGKRVRIISPHSATTFDSGDDASLSTDESQQHHPFPPRVRSPPPAVSLHSILSKGGKVNPFDLELSDSSDDDESPLTAVKDTAVAQTQETRIDAQPDYLSTNLKEARNDTGLSNRRGLNTEDGSDEGTQNERLSSKNGPKTPPNPFPSASGHEESPTESPLRTTFHTQADTSTSMGSGHRTPMDVDAFKRLLLTGAKGSAPSTLAQPPALGQHGSQGDNSSNTDTSSLSRNSVLDSQTDLRLETPASSHDITPLDEERQFSLPAAGSRPGRTEPPPPPRRRGSDLGKPHLTRTNLEQPTSTLSKAGNMRPLSVITDLNNPLLVHRAADIEASIQPDSPLSSTFGAAPRPRVAPPPPLSRRNSQMRAKQQHFHGRSNSIAEEILPPSRITHPPPPVTNKAPAPPPPRRKGTDHAITILPENTPAAPEAPAGLQAQANQTPAKVPPPPPSRAGFKAKAARPPQTSGVSRSATIPPPPPPRHRASSGSSHASQHAGPEIARSSTDSRSPGSHVVSNEGESQPPGEEKDILADLSALQKELDAYRTTFGS